MIEGLFFAIILNITFKMNFLFKIKIIIFFLLSISFSFNLSHADNHELNETLEQIKKDIITLVKAV